MCILSALVSYYQYAMILLLTARINWAMMGRVNVLAAAFCFFFRQCKIKKRAEHAYRKEGE